MKKKIFTLITLAVLAASSCKNLNVNPSDSISTGTIVTTTDGLTNALNGAYALFKDHIEFNGTVDGTICTCASSITCRLCQR
jgi:hypothetical protein